MPKVTFLPDNISVDAKAGEKLTDIASKAGIEIPQACGGVGACSSCRVIVKEGSPEEKNEMEEMWGLPEGERLSCQTLVKDTDLIVEIPQ